MNRWPVGSLFRFRGLGGTRKYADSHTLATTTPHRNAWSPEVEPIVTRCGARSQRGAVRRHSGPGNQPIGHHPNTRPDGVDHRVESDGARVLALTQLVITSTHVHAISQDQGIPFGQREQAAPMAGIQGWHTAKDHHRRQS